MKRKKIYLCGYANGHIAIPKSDTVKEIESACEELRKITEAIGKGQAFLKVQCV